MYFVQILYNIQSSLFEVGWKVTILFKVSFNWKLFNNFCTHDFWFWSTGVYLLISKVWIRAYAVP